MKRKVPLSLLLITAGILLSKPAPAQAQPVQLDSNAVEKVQLTSDHLRDSLEVVLLSTSQTYSQVERIINAVTLDPQYLDLIPSVLPVNVPLESFRISSPYGIRRHPIHQKVRFHNGVDVIASTGMAVKATASGVVRQVGHDAALGVFVRIQHDFGFETTYGHLSGYCVKPGQVVARSEEIGKVGSTGLATGPHLHYVIKKNGSNVDPFQFCFLLRRRLWLYQRANPAGSCTSGLDSAKAVFIDG